MAMRHYYVPDTDDDGYEPQKYNVIEVSELVKRKVRVDEFENEDDAVDIIWDNEQSISCVIREAVMCLKALADGKNFYSEAEYKRMADDLESIEVNDDFDVKCKYEKE